MPCHAWCLRHVCGKLALRLRLIFSSSPTLNTQHPTLPLAIPTPPPPNTMRPSSQLLLPAFTALTVFAPSTAAWGMLGHRTVALLASRYLLPETAAWVKGLLPGSQSMVTASTWPDYYAHTPGGRYSAPWHWIDSKDNPPHTCEVNYKRDCHGEEGCIVSAIVNMVCFYSFQSI